MMAAEDVGGRVLGRPIEIVSADDQNKPDTAAVNACRWFDQDPQASAYIRAT